MITHESPAPVATPPPAETLYSALEELGRAQREAAAWMARRLDWPRAGVGVVRMLARCGPVQLTDVAARLRVDVSVASRQVGQLVDAGYVRRTVDADDRRARVLELTDEGHALVGELSARFSALFGEVFDGWTAADLTDAVDQIRRVAAAISTIRDLSHDDEEGTH
ncbi:transcriptional regulator, MarR family [Xylanimonas cellulosilytica DSM 15894]|uniref:Transcriptional regulator, MarR family n=1 Tax=Xylanimonas cellulosilytica (strain DSM 15894 / JCM 12276 / CECT 5975 / KCTC 9989 / LMG 20990 / NBRC 107835 / XIL07) TaxID=446471 RepID=D1BUU5_XYLCX|nr:MarR family transcriptional regulator [Xylanimonas cellulosilytica]ACZ29336.1 transcriptional regulator, MarR family [Xylanimonas cellulosilytica DSM 15894]